MADAFPPGCSQEELRAEIARLGRVNNALMDRAERSTRLHGSDFGVFQTTLMLENQVRRRTEELEAAFRENERINRVLRESEAKFRGLVNQSLVGIAIIEDGRFAHANPRMAQIFGYAEEEMLSLAPADTAAGADRQLVDEQIRRRLSGEVDQVSYLFHGLRKDGNVIDVECHSSVMEANGKKVLISLMMDVTERLRAERAVQALQDQLREQAIRDPLTGLYNRLPLNEFFDRELTLAKRRGQPVSIVMADLDHFKKVNDAFGHLGGDEILRGFGGLIRGSYRTSDIHCRYGGEEFLVLLPDMSHDIACERTERLRQSAAANPMVYGGFAIQVTATFGVATFPQHGETRDALIAAADGALYAGKKCGRNQVRSAAEALRKPGRESTSLMMGK